MWLLRGSAHQSPSSMALPSRLGPDKQFQKDNPGCLSLGRGLLPQSLFPHM